MKSITGFSLIKTLHWNSISKELLQILQYLSFIGVRLPTGNKTIYSYFIDMEYGTFVPWDALVPSTKSLIEKGAIITIGETMGVAMEQKKAGGDDSHDIVPTVDVIRFSFLTSLLLLNKHPVLLTG